MAPGEVKTDVGNFRGAIAGPRQTIVYRSVEDNIEYKVTVMSFLQAQAEGATLLGERQYMFQDRKMVLMDTFSRVGSGKDAVYGRKIVVDLPDNKGRTTGAFYFTKGRLISVEATVLPAKGSFASPLGEHVAGADDHQSFPKWSRDHSTTRLGLRSTGRDTL